MPPVIKSRSTSFDPIQETKNLSLQSNKPKRRVKKKSSPKRVRIDGQVHLKHSWSMWYDEDSTSSPDATQIGTFNTAQGFWRYYNQIVDPSNFPNKSLLSIYKQNPTSPSDAPKKVCKWTIPSSKNDTGKVWMKVVLAMIGEQFSYNQDISGVVISVSPVVDNVILYGSSCSNSSRIERTTSELRKLIENDTIHVLSYQRELSSSMPRINTSDGNSFQNNRKFVSSNDLAAEENAAKTKHKKSSSFSNTQFPDMKENFKRHRKTKSDSKKGFVNTSRKSNSFSDELPNISSITTTTPLSSKRLSLFAQLYNNGTDNVEPFQINREKALVEEAVTNITSQNIKQNNSNNIQQQNSSLNLSRMIALFVLVLLVLSGFLFTPK